VVKTDRELDVQILLPLLDPVCEVNPGIGGRVIAGRGAVDLNGPSVSKARLIIDLTCA